MAEHLGRRRPVTYTTVLVAMQKLEKKGWLTHRVRRAARMSIVRRRTREVAQAGLVYGDAGGRASTAIPSCWSSQLVDARPWSGEELSQLRQLIDARRKEKRHG